MQNVMEGLKVARIAAHKFRTEPVVGVPVPKSLLAVRDASGQPGTLSYSYWL